jgi:SMC interacting uncharacterized protein involved in chromosome segregation
MRIVDKLLSPFMDPGGYSFRARYEDEITEVFNLRCRFFEELTSLDVTTKIALTGKIWDYELQLSAYDLWLSNLGRTLGLFERGYDARLED